MQNYGDIAMSDGGLVKRWIIYLLGIYILTLGVTFAIRAGIGISPQSSLTRTMTVINPHLTQGTYEFILELIMLGFTYLIMPKDFKWRKFTGLIPALALSVSLDFNLMLTSPIKLHIYVEKLLLLAIGDATLAFGLFLMIRANLVLMPVDDFVNTVFKKTRKKWGNIKTIYDLSFLVLTTCIGLIFLHKIMFIREGTILNAILVGQYIKLYTYFYRRIQTRKSQQEVFSDVSG